LLIMFLVSVKFSTASYETSNDKILIISNTLNHSSIRYLLFNFQMVILPSFIPQVSYKVL